MSQVSFPPHHSKSSKPISPSLALNHLQAYLTAASTSPYLLPNATLQTTGPVAPSDAASNLTIQHLQRVEAGLRGEWLAPTLDLAEADAFADQEQNGNHKRFSEGGETVDVEMGTDGWQDLDEYQREQSVEVGEATQETTLASDLVEGRGAVEVKIEAVEQKQDKEARKRDKKEKEKALKREKAEKARLAASA